MEQRRDFIVPLQLLVTSETVWEERSTREDSWLHSAGWLICVIKRTRRRSAEEKDDFLDMAPKDTAYTRWSCHSSLANPVQIVYRLLPPPAMGVRLPFLASRPCGPAGCLAMLLIKADDVETNPGPTTTYKQVWICDICHWQIQVRK